MKKFYNFFKLTFWYFHHFLATLDPKLLADSQKIGKSHFLVDFERVLITKAQESYWKIKEFGILKSSHNAQSFQEYVSIFSIIRQSSWLLTFE